MALNNSTVTAISSVLKDSRRRFITRYAEVSEGLLTTTGERALLCSMRPGIIRDFDEDDMFQRLSFLVKSGVRLGRVLDYGIDGRQTPYILTEWRKLEPATFAVRHHGSPADVLWQIVAQVEKLHRGGMPFGDISEETFLIDPSGRVYICGIPAYGLPLAADATSEKVVDYIAPESGKTGHDLEVDTDDLFSQDIYAIGVCAHHLFARKAFPRPSSPQQLHEYLTGQTPNLLTLYQTVPPWALGLISRCIEWNPEDRAPIFEIRDIARQGTTLKQQISRLLSDLKDVPRPRVNWRSVLHPTSQQITAGALFTFSAMVFVYLGTTWFRQWRPDNLRVDFAQAYDTVDAALNTGPFSGKKQAASTVSAASTARLPFESAPEVESVHESVTEALDEESAIVEVSVNTAAGVARSLKAKKRGRRRSSFERYVGEKTNQPPRKSRLWATPERELISLLTRPPGLPRSQFYTVGFELVSRNNLNPPARLALLALLHLDPSQLPPETTKALIHVVDGTISAEETADLMSLQSEDVDYVLAAITAYSPFPSASLQAYSALASRSLQAEPMRTIISLAKLENWVRTAGDLQAIGVLSLGPFAGEAEQAGAWYRLLDKSRPLDVLLFENGTAFSFRDAPWCPLVEL